MTCYLTGSEAGGVGQVERLTITIDDELGRTIGGGLETSFSYTGTLMHDPKVCEGASVCKYAFSAYNPSAFAQPRQVTVRADIRTD